jgi:8-oxo-dGTP diphosphatase
VRPESAAHDDHVWATEEEWRRLPTWYTEEDLDALWDAIKSLEPA